MAAKKKNSLKYGEAKEKLEKILREIEGDEVDVDDLGDKVKEAAELIHVCKEKLQKTRVQVEKVIADMELDDDMDEESEDGGAADEGGLAAGQADDDAPF